MESIEIDERIKSELQDSSVLELDKWEDWKKNETKRKTVDYLNKISLEEREKLSEIKILSIKDLCERWEMDNRQSVHHYRTRDDFPEPVYLVSNRFPVFLETEIQQFEIKHPYILNKQSRINYQYWMYQNVISKKQQEDFIHWQQQSNDQHDNLIDMLDSL